MLCRRTARKRAKLAGQRVRLSSSPFLRRSSRPLMPLSPPVLSPERKAEAMSVDPSAQTMVEGEAQRITPEREVLRAILHEQDTGWAVDAGEREPNDRLIVCQGKLERIFAKAHAALAARPVVPEREADEREGPACGQVWNHHSDGAYSVVSAGHHLTLVRLRDGREFPNIELGYFLESFKLAPLTPEPRRLHAAVESAPVSPSPPNSLPGKLGHTPAEPSSVGPVSPSPDPGELCGVYEPGSGAPGRDSRRCAKVRGHDGAHAPGPANWQGASFCQRCGLDSRWWGTTPCPQAAPVSPSPDEGER